MDKLWKIISEKKWEIRFYQNASYSPYSECLPNCIDKRDGIIKIGINSFYRYDNIMQPLFKERNLNNKYQEWIFDVYIHYLAELEYRSGITVQEIQVRRYWNDLEKGSYGEKIRSLFNALSTDNKYYIAHALWRQAQNKETVDILADVLVFLLSGGIVYKNKWSEKQLLLYLNEKKNEDSLSKIEMIQQLFLPLGYSLRVFWENHFAVIGEEQTMVIDEMELL